MRAVGGSWALGRGLKKGGGWFQGVGLGVFGGRSSGLGGLSTP
ncbi:hypothetical protein ACFOPX_08390 [Helicobacter baculiformis]|uniref:Uncharacterized protein n=1 Tax=Helicobacter baculiformis TaxID=427351 RepID=A0ABV7ZM05_9HELI|nr:hypothetical protein [Helicobacter baculiformis]